VSAEVKLNWDDVHRVMRQSARMGGIVARTLKRSTERFVAHIAAEASRRAPLGDTGTLRRSVSHEVQLTEAGVLGRVTFGGLASAYAEVQHENPGYVHDEAGYVAKYHRPLSRTMTLRKYRTEITSGRMTTKGVLSITARTALKARPRKHRLGYRGGQAHWLYGAANSAYTAEEHRRFLRQVAIDLDNMAARELGR